MSRIAPVSKNLTPRPVATLRAVPPVPAITPRQTTSASSFERAPAGQQKQLLLPTSARPGRVPARGSYPSGAQIDRILAMQNPVERNYAITQGYHDLSKAFARVVGDENANWTTYAVWASRQAGVTIRQEDAPGLLVDLLEKSDDVGRALEQAKKALGPLGALLPPVSGLLRSGDGALDAVSEQIAIGNREVFAEISREFARFIETFGGDTRYDQAKVDAYLAGFGPEQATFRDGMAAYAKARFETDPEKKAELMFLGNALVGLHEQTFLQTFIERGMNAPVEEVVGKNLQSLFEATLPGKLLSKAGVLDDALRPLVSAISNVARRVLTEQMMKLAMPERTLKLGDDVVGPNGGAFPDALRTIEDPELRAALAKIDRSPDSLEGSAAKDWNRLDDRMNFIVDLFRAYQQDPTLFDEPFETAQARVA